MADSAISGDVLETIDISELLIHLYQATSHNMKIENVKGFLKMPQEGRES
jgi:hypothetical protein